MEGSSDKTSVSPNFQRSLVDNISDFETKLFHQCGDASKSVHDSIEFIVDLCINSVICYIGAINNIVAILVLTKLGFQNTINISLTSVAAWDLTKCLCSVINKLYGPIGYVNYYFSIQWKIVTTFIFGNLYVLSRHISSSLTAYIALERCLCVSLPFTVKFLLTRRLVVCINILLPTVVICLYCPVFAIYSLKFVYDPCLDKTTAVLYYTSLYYEYPGIHSFITTMLILSPSLTWSIMIICTVIISFFLRRASKVRAGMKSEEKASHLSGRDRQVIKMLLTTIIVNIVAFIPQLLVYGLTVSMPELRIDGCLKNYYWIGSYVITFFDYLNASANPIIFFFMSSAYKSALLGLFKLDEKMAK